MPSWLTLSAGLGCLDMNFTILGIPGNFDPCQCTQGIDAYFLKMSNCLWQLPEFCGLLPEGLSKAVYKISAHWLN